MGIWRRLVLTGVVVGMGGVSAGRVEAQRLPGGARPEHYSLTIVPDLKSATFVGGETIDLVLDAPAKTITLNAAEIEFVSVRATAGTGSAQVQKQIPFGNDKNKANANAGIPPLAALGRDDGISSGDATQTAVVTLDAAMEQATFTFAQELPAGRVRLEIAYQGILNDRLRGFYLSKTKERRYGVTQFESTDARRAFPCFDEPALKATFNVTLVVDAGDTVISNTPVVSDTAGPGTDKHTVAFATTPKMSTYLVAWLVGDFACTAGKSDGVPIRVCATPDKVKLTRFALDAAKQTLHDYDKYFGIKYPLAKLDLVAIPDFEAGAMENFGCITFRETELLVDKKNGSLAAKKEVAETVAHEMSHQWFGDLVTPKWWDDIWLNEGFATWMENKEAAKEHPKWRYDQDAAEVMDRTMNEDEDASGTTRAIRIAAWTPAEIEEMFDDIAYDKAAAVIAMMENWVGEETFRKGIQAYLTAHEYGNTTAEDFWDAETRVSGLPVDKAMQSFVVQSGIPLLTIGDATAGTLSVTQRLFQPSDPSSSTRGSAASGAMHPAWTIPVCIESVPCQLLTPQTRALQESAGARFFFANTGDKGYYRTEYTPGQWSGIVANAETGLTPPERIGLLGDRWALMQAGEGTVGEFLDLALAVKRDPNAVVLESALGKVGTIEGRIATDADREQLDGVVRREFGGVYAALGGPRRHEADDREELRETLFEALGQAGDPAVLAEAASETAELFAGKKPADEALMDAAISLTVAHGDAAMYEKMLRVAQNSTDPDLKVDGLHTLTRFEAPALVERTLEYAVSDQVRNQDSWILIAQLLSRRTTQDAAWAFVQQHWPEIARKATLSSGARIVEATGSFCTVERRDEVAGFFRAHRVASARRTLARSIGNIDDCIHLRAAQEPELRRWLDAHAGQ